MMVIKRKNEKKQENHRFPRKPRGKAESKLHQRAWVQFPVVLMTTCKT
jgi:hypothetical protein